MENPGINNQVKAVFITAVCLLLAIFLGWTIGSSDYESLIWGTLVVLAIVSWFGAGQWFWVITIASAYLGGTFPILRGAFTPFQILMAVGILKFFVEDVIMRRVSFAEIERSQVLLIAGFMAVLTLHGLPDRFGMRFLGSEVWGGANYINVYVGLVAFFVIQSISVKSKIWNKLPYLVLAVASFDLFIAIVTTALPSSIDKIYPFYSNVGTAGVVELLTGEEDITGRIGSFGNFGYILVSIVLAATPIHRLLSLQYFPRLVPVAIGSLAVLYSVFRTSVANLFATFMAAGFRDLRWGILAFVPIVAALLFGLSAVNSSVVRLPKQMQRALSFIPGDWDNDMALDAASSNDFRQRVWKIWAQEYFPNQPLLGRGFGFKSEWTKTSVVNPQATDYKQMVEVGNIHNGLFASLDAVGIVGTLFFIVWNGQLLFRTFRVSFDKTNVAGFALRFLALQLAVSILCYWVGAITLGTFLPRQFALAGVFLKLYRDTQPKPVPVRAKVLPLPQEQPQEVAHT